MSVSSQSAVLSPHLDARRCSWGPTCSGKRQSFRLQWLTGISRIRAIGDYLTQFLVPTVLVI
jgi:hypothetical protein